MAAESAGRPRGRPVLGGVAGFFFGLFLAVDLLLMSVLPANSILVLVLPIAFLAIGVLLGIWPPLGFLRRS